MVKDSENESSVVGSNTSHRCGVNCLGPLTFHREALGDMVSLSQGCRLAKRIVDTFKNGLVFSSRPVMVQERIRLRVERDLLNWHGALRVGFTNVPPSARSLPLPCMAIPNLTETHGHWAAPVHESYCQAGSELEFWACSGGNVHVRSITSNNIRQQKLLAGVDTRKPLWAMIDIYGQTCSILLLGSEKRGLFCIRRSCPAPERLTSPDVGNQCSLIPDVSSLCGNSKDCTSRLDMDIPAGEGGAVECVACMEKKATIILPCGHRCLCRHCASRVFQLLGTCPLCRQAIRAPSVEGGVSLRCS